MVQSPSLRKKAACVLLLLNAAIFPVHSQLTNAALGKAVTASGPVFDAQRAPGMITDGSASTFSHRPSPSLLLPHWDSNTRSILAASSR